MSTKQPSKFGDSPPSHPSERRGAPLPLVTQPMIPIDGLQEAGQTRTDNPVQGSVTLRPGSVPVSGVAISRTQTTVNPPMQTRATVAQSPTGGAPEIGLTQHHLTTEAPDSRLALILDPDSERAAAFRVMRHHLLELGRPQCIIISSPNGGDGKTTVALNLALALAECGRAKVLLAETHVRRPQLANVFRFVPPWCFAEQLAAHRHQPMMPWSLIEIPQLWLHVAAINPRIEKTQLLDGPAFAIAMERLRLGGYDHIVIDAPPVLGSADVNLMSDAADAVVLSLRSRRSTARDVRRAIDQLGASKVVGTVLV